MPKSNLNAVFEGKSTDEKIEAIQNYLFQLNEELEFMFKNLGLHNFNENSLKELKKYLGG